MRGPSPWTDVRAKPARGASVAVCRFLAWPSPTREAREGRAEGGVALVPGEALEVRGRGAGDARGWPPGALASRDGWRADYDAKLRGRHGGEQLGLPEAELGRDRRIVHEDPEFATLMSDHVTLARQRHGHAGPQSTLHRPEAGGAREHVRQTGAGTIRPPWRRREQFVAAAYAIPAIAQ